MKKNNEFYTYSRYNYYDILYDYEARGYILGLGYNNIPYFEETDNDMYYTIEPQYQYRPDLLALKFYGSEYLWWVIVKANNLSHPLKELVAGKVIRIPAASRVLSEV